MRDPYRRIASVYDRAVEPFNTGIRKYAFKLASVKSGANILEVGCGTGSNLELYLQHGCNVYGVDLSPAMIAIAKDKLGDSASLSIIDASAMKIYEEDKFDLVLAMLTLHEMPQNIRMKVVGEMIRVTKKDGRILLVDYYPGPLRFPMGWIYKGIILFFEIAAGREHYKNYKNFIKNGALSPLLEGRALRLVKKKIISKGNFSIYLFEKK